MTSKQPVSSSNKEELLAEERLCMFFDVLLKIDKRNNSRIYESIKSGIDSDKA